MAALKRLRQETLEPLIVGHRGRVVKLMGDGFLVEFASVVDAVECAIAWQAERHASDDQRLRFRIGVNLGDIVVDEEDIHGDGVNLAARLESAAQPGAVCISAIVHDQVERRLEHRFADLGDRELKNIDRPTRIWQWAPEDQGAVAEPAAELGASEKPSLVILPFDNRSDDAEQGYFADGITEDLITEVSRIASLMVIARHSSFTYKNRSVAIAEVCRELAVRYVLEGSVRKAGGRVRITAQLVDGKSGGHLWAERYDRSLEDIFAVQDDVTEMIVQALKIELIGSAAEHKIAEQGPNPEAYDCILRGREQYRLFTRRSNQVARSLFEEASQIDPDYGEAYAGLAETYV